MRRHLPLLFIFSVGIVCVWLLPVQMAGFTYKLPGLMPLVRDYVSTGLVSTSMRLPILLTAPFSTLLTWESTVPWAIVNAIFFAVGLVAWWVFVEKAFSRAVAWVSIVILAFMPLYWAEVLDVRGYAFAFTFLFIGLAIYIYAIERSRIVAIGAFALCFGAALACKDAFITFLPWIVAAHVYVYRSEWKSACREVALFLLLAYSSFVFSLFPNALQPEMTIMERVAIFLPSSANGTPGTGHLYPDDYIYEFYRDEFDLLTEERIASSSFLTKQEDLHYRYIFGVGEINFFDGVLSGLWLSVNSIPNLVLQEYVGGAFLWLFIVPGIAWFYRERRQLLFWIGGLWISMEFILKFVLHFGRSHLMDIGFVLALFAAVGVVDVSTVLTKKYKKVSIVTCITLVTILIAMQLVQANRKLLAHLYSRSSVPEAHAAATVLSELPENVLIAHPRRHNFFYFVERPRLELHSPSIEFLSQRGELVKPFQHYKITHIFGYSDEQTALIKDAVPNIQVLDLPEGGINRTYSPFVKYILHLIR